MTCVRLDLILRLLLANSPVAKAKQAINTQLNMLYLRYFEKIDEDEKNAAVLFATKVQGVQFPGCVRISSCAQAEHLSRAQIKIDKMEYPCAALWLNAKFMPFKPTLVGSKPFQRSAAAA